MKQLFNRTNGEDSNHVHTTTDYSLFKQIKGNRDLNPLHLKRLKKSISENYLFTVIIVNENYEIIDGQHRFECIKELRLPLNYMIKKGYNLNHVRIMNQNSKTWQGADYLDTYAGMGLKDYILLKDFCKRHNIGLTAAMIISGSGAGKEVLINFYNGSWKFKDFANAEKMVYNIKMIKPYYDGYLRTSFISAMLKLMSKPFFNNDEFIEKLKMQPTTLKHCVNVDRYIELIEYIYNYRRHEKVNLRY